MGIRLRREYCSAQGLMETCRGSRRREVGEGWALMPQSLLAPPFTRSCDLRASVKLPKTDPNRQTGWGYKERKTFPRHPCLGGHLHISLRTARYSGSETFRGERDPSSICAPTPLFISEDMENRNREGSNSPEVTQHISSRGGRMKA